MRTQCDKLKRKFDKYTVRNDRCSRPRISFRCVLLFVACVCISLYIWTWRAVRLEYDGHSDEVMRLYYRFLDQYKLSQSQPLYTASDRVPIPQNPNYRRTKTVQYLYDYIEAATKELSNKSTGHPSVECVDSFSEEHAEYMPAFTKAVQSLLSDASQNYSLYHSRMTAFSKRDIITQDTHSGLPDTVGQRGVFATQFLPQFTVIDHYFGDEYLDWEFDARFYTFMGMNHHPFGQKWSYCISVSSHRMIDARCNLGHLAIPIASDIFFAYNHSKYYMSDEEYYRNLAQLGEQKDVWAPFINDARKYFRHDFLFDADAKRKNCEYVQCLINGVVQTFVIAIRDIPENEQLFIYYGPSPF